MTQLLSPKKTFFGVQALRGLAALLVVAHHSTQLWSVRMHPASASLGWGNGAAGVDIFFVISGFVMALTGMGSRPMLATTFLRRRFVRVVPMYWLCTVLAIASLAMRYRSALSGRHELGFLHVLASFLFLPTRNIAGQVAPVLAVGWTLSYEMFFYLIFALALALAANPVRLLIPLMIAISCIGAIHRDSWPAITVLTQPIILEFLAGSLLGYAVLKHRQWNPLLLGILGPLGLAVLLLVPRSNDLSRPLVWGLPAFLIVSATVMLESRLAPFIPRWLLRIGDASYSLYLIHLFVLNPLTTISPRIPVLLHSETAFVLAGLASSTLIALVVYRFLEVPLTLWLTRNQRLPPPAVIVLGEHIETTH